MSKYLGAVKLLGATAHRAVPDPSLVLFRDRPQAPINGVGRLPAALTINSVTQTPFFRFNAGEGLVTASAWTPWGYGGENLAIAVVAGAPTLNWGSPALNRPVDDSVRFVSDYYQASTNVIGDVTTEDVVIECVVRFSGVSAERVIDKRNGNNAGWLVYCASATTLGLYAQVAAGTNAQVTSAALTAGAWYHCMFFVDRSGSAQCYIDGAASGSPATFSTLSASWTIAQPFCIGARPTGNPYSSCVAYVCGWRGAAWLDTHLQATVAEQRASLFWGWRPQQARGTAVPTARARASIAHTDKIDTDGRKLYLVGQDVPRCAGRLGTSNRLLKGYLPELQTTNICLRSEEINLAPWAATRASVTNTSVTTLPNGDTSVSDVIHEDASVSTTHFINQAITYTLDAAHVWSGFFKPINRNFISVNVRNGGAGWSCLFNVSAGTYDISSGANLTAAGVIPYRNGWYRCWILYTLGATGAFTLYYLLHNGVSASFTGANQDTIYCWGNQVENGVEIPTSYIPTAGASVIREEDVLRYRGDDGNLGGVGSNLRGEIRSRVLLPSVSSPLNRRIVTLSDGGSAADTLYLRSNTSDQPEVASAASGGSAGSSVRAVDIVDGAVHDVAAKWTTDNLLVYADGTAGTADTDVDIPNDLDRIDVGADASGVTQPNGVIADLEFYPREARGTP